MTDAGKQDDQGMKKEDYLFYSGEKSRDTPGLDSFRIGIFLRL